MFSNMICPLCKKEIRNIIFYSQEVGRCPGCGGLWFQRDELRKAKDSKDKGLSWLDIDLWEQRAQFHVSLDKKACPECNVPLYEV